VTIDGAGVMGLFVLDMVFSIFGIRDGIPGFDHQTPPTLSAIFIRALVAIAAVLASLLLTVWVTVWLAMELL
jgi:hypothetical protein